MWCHWMWHCEKRCTVGPVSHAQTGCLLPQDKQVHALVPTEIMLWDPSSSCSNGNFSSFTSAGTSAVPAFLYFSFKSCIWCDATYPPVTSDRGCTRGKRLPVLLSITFASLHPGILLLLWSVSWKSNSKLVSPEFWTMLLKSLISLSLKSVECDTYSLYNFFFLSLLICTSLRIHSGKHLITVRYKYNSPFKKSSHLHLL